MAKPPVPAGHPPWPPLGVLSASPMPPEHLLPQKSVTMHTDMQPGHGQGQDAAAFLLLYCPCATTAGVPLSIKHTVLRELHHYSCN